MRALSAIAAVQGGTLCGAGSARDVPLSRLADALAQHELDMESFADRGGFRLAARLTRLWSGTFPLILPPEGEDGLGVVILDSNADTNFSFTNALGIISAVQAFRLTEALKRYPRAGWIVALHHHITEYPKPVATFSERVGTALINGSWFLRVLKPTAKRIVVMHGHRHVDWVGACGSLKIISAPSPVMIPDGVDAHFYIHTLAIGPDGELRLMQPDRLTVAAELSTVRPRSEPA
jgi:hypothetical protein